MNSDRCLNWLVQARTPLETVEDRLPLIEEEVQCAACEQVWNVLRPVGSTTGASYCPFCARWWRCATTA